MEAARKASLSGGWVTPGQNHVGGITPVTLISAKHHSQAEAIIIVPSALGKRTPFPGDVSTTRFKVLAWGGGCNRWEGKVGNGMIETEGGG